MQHVETFNVGHLLSRAHPAPSMETLAICSSLKAWLLGTCNDSFSCSLLTLLSSYWCKHRFAGYGVKISCCKQKTVLVSKKKHRYAGDGALMHDDATLPCCSRLRSLHLAS